MDDKQIIIDGVDVSVCKLYNEDNGVVAPDGTAERTELCYLTNDYCENNPNCYYKQLKRKEQECEKIKNWVKGMMFYTDCSNWFERFTTAFDDWKNDLISQLDQLKIENKKLKETLIEIQQDLEYATYCESQECGCDDTNECLECTKKQILQKIKEVLNGTNP